jgi:nucleoside transporter
VRQGDKAIMKLGIRIQLSVMMFIQFTIWGAWAVTMGAYLNKIGFSGVDIGSAYSTTAWAAIVSPFFIGMVADRFFPAQVVLGVLHLLGAGLMFVAAKTTDPGSFFWILLAYALCYMPTLALVNAISFHQMQDPSKEFPAIRVLGTLGWIAIGIVIGKVVPSMTGGAIEETNLPLLIAAGTSVLMGVFSFTLPNTPPKGAGKKITVSDILGLETLKLMKDPSFLIFIIGSLLICIPLAFYYNFTNTFLNEIKVANPAFKMTFGQMSEVGFMLILPLLFARLGVKKMLLFGMIAWAARYFLFAYGNADSLVWMLLLGIILHGICYDFFFVTGQIYVDRKAPEEIRAAAQGFIGLITYGAGMAIGSKISGLVVDHYKAGEVHNWQAIWVVPAMMAVGIIIMFALFFKDKSESAK